MDDTPQHVVNLPYARLRDHGSPLARAACVERSTGACGIALSRLDGRQGNQAFQAISPPACWPVDPVMFS
jgi:hypothetical protein